MKSTILIAAAAILAAVTSASLSAADRDPARRGRPAAGYDQAMQVVHNGAAPGEPGHGWRYFADPTTHRAVVISPQGDYYYSDGKGLRRVTGTPPGA